MNRDVSADQLAADGQKPPSFAECADWYLTGSALADPTELLKGLLAEHRELVARLEAAERERDEALIRGEKWKARALPAEADSVRRTFLLNEALDRAEAAEAENERLRESRERERRLVDEWTAQTATERERAEAAEAALADTRQALERIRDTAAWYAKNGQRLQHEVDHALCVEILSYAEDALAGGGTGQEQT